MINTEICHLETTLNQLKKTKEFPLKFCNGQKGKAALEVTQFDVTKVPAFTDYLKDGWEIALIGAIDFTYSNGPPSNPSSLHFTG